MKCKKQEKIDFRAAGGESGLFSIDLGPNHSAAAITAFFHAQAALGASLRIMRTIPRAAFGSCPPAIGTQERAYNQPSTRARRASSAG